jgi:hypothetical protein
LLALIKSIDKNDLRRVAGYVTSGLTKPKWLQDEHFQLLFEAHPEYGWVPGDGGKNFFPDSLEDVVLD